MLMANNSLTTDQLRRALSIKEQIEALETQLNQVLGGAAPTTSTGPVRGRRKRSAATRAKMAAAQRARWAKKVAKPAKAARRKVSAAARARMAAAARARWKKAKAAGKKSLGG
jgi:hypothetical protein